MKGKNRVLQSFFHLTITIGTTQDLYKETQSFITWLIDEIRPVLSALFLLDKEKNEFWLIQAYGFKPEEGSRLPLGIDLWRWLGEQGAPIPDEGDPRRYIVPIIVENRLLGTLCIISTHRVIEKIREEQRLVETASGYLAPVLRNVLQYNILENLVAERTATIEEAKRKLEAEIKVRRGIEERLSEERNLLRNLIDSIPDPIYIKDSKSRFVTCNKAIAHLMGVKEPDELIGKTDFDFYPKALAQRYFKEEQAIMSSGQPVIDGEEPLLDMTTGRKGWLLTTKIPLKDRAGKVMGLIGIGRDITSLKQIEQTLREDKQLIEAVMETAPVLIVLTEPEGNIIFFNNTCEKLTGYDRGEVNKKSISTFFLPEDWISVVQERFENPNYPEMFKPHENYWVTRSGEKRLIEWRCVPVELSGYTKPCILVVGTDITEHKQLEEQFLHAQKMEAVGRLAGGVAHDFNNMLTAILGYAELALEKLQSESTLYSYLKEIIQAGEKATSLTSQLLAFSRKQILQPQVLNINDVIKNLERMLRRLIGENIELITVLDPTLEHVRADPTQVEQVIMNLTVNARDAMPEGGKITIETLNVYLDEEYAASHVSVKPGNYVMLAVGDTGVGMDREVLSHIFEPFFTTKRMDKGTGLGLSTVYGIIKQSGGNIWVHSEQGKGSTFKIYLPQVEEVAEAGKKDGVGRKEVRGTETVMVVEDDEQVRDIACRSLNHYGYNVLVAKTPGEALRISSMHNGPIHITVTDFIMPEMNGIELIEKLFKQRPEMKVLYMSGYTDNTIVDYGIFEEGVPFLQKPFTPEIFVHKIRDVLG